MNEAVVTGGQSGKGGGGLVGRDGGLFGQGGPGAGGITCHKKNFVSTVAQDFCQMDMGAASYKDIV